MSGKAVSLPHSSRRHTEPCPREAKPAAHSHARCSRWRNGPRTRKPRPPSCKWQRGERAAIRPLRAFSQAGIGGRVAEAGRHACRGCVPAAGAAKQSHGGADFRTPRRSWPAHRMDERLTAEFPEYGEFSSPAPVPVQTVQALLGPEEALRPDPRHGQVRHRAGRDFHLGGDESGGALGARRIQRSAHRWQDHRVPAGRPRPAAGATLSPFRPRGRTRRSRRRLRDALEIRARLHHSGAVRSPPDLGDTARGRQGRRKPGSPASRSPT